MDTHVQRLGIVSIAFGAFSLVFAMALLLYFGDFAAIFNFGEGLAGFGFIAVALVLSHLIVGIPFIVAGWFVQQYQNWARFLMIVLCGVSMLIVPFGSLIALYGLWVLLTPETEPLFIQPPHRNNRRRTDGIDRNPMRK